MSAIASQITSLTIVYSIVYSDADQRKHESSASLAFVWGIHRGPVNSPHKWPVTRKMFSFDDVIMWKYRLLNLHILIIDGLSSGPLYLSYSKVHPDLTLHTTIFIISFFSLFGHSESAMACLSTTVTKNRTGLLATRAPTQIARFVGPTWGPSGADRTQVGPMLAPWTLLSGHSSLSYMPSPRLIHIELASVYALAPGKRLPLQWSQWESNCYQLLSHTPLDQVSGDLNQGLHTNVHTRSVLVWHSS